jgi:hypothetical protein
LKTRCRGPIVVDEDDYTFKGFTYTTICNEMIRRFKEQNLFGDFGLVDDLSDDFYEIEYIHNTYRQDDAYI